MFPLLPIFTLPETGKSHLKMDAWIVSFWDGIFSGAFAVSFGEGNGRKEMGFTGGETVLLLGVRSFIHS